MNSTDLTIMLSNLAKNLLRVQALLTGAAYILGLVFVYIGITRFKGVAEKGSQERPMVAMAYVLGGAALIFIPTSMDVISNTLFGTGNILEYAKYNRGNIYSVMGIVIQTAGIIWAIRGIVLIIHASEPGDQEGFKGLTFLIAGILAFNFDSTMAMINSMLTQLTSWTIAIKQSQGY